MNGITVIIAHYAPAYNTSKYYELLIKTIISIKKQILDFPIEIIVCDDGSHWSKDLVKSEGITEYDQQEIEKIVLLKDIKADKYLILPNIDKYRGITLKHYAISNSKYDKIVILDDDHPFIRDNSLALYHKYLTKYEFVRGRVIGTYGRPQLFLSHNAQGTNYGIRKDLYVRINGFGTYLYENGYGEDNDILMRIFKELTKEKNQIKRACWAGEIVTKDLASNRWADRSASILQSEQVNLLSSPHLRHESFVKDFIKYYDVHPFKNNPSRIKRGWIEYPSLLSILSEIKYISIYLLIIPRIIHYRYQRVKNRGGLKFAIQKLNMIIKQL